MVAPLKTWQHAEPKALWPALSSLAIVAHIGVFGLSLPYLLRLMEPSGHRSAAAIPIQLVESGPAEFELSELDSSKTDSSDSPQSRLADANSNTRSEPQQTTPSNADGPSKTTAVEAPTSSRILTSESDRSSTVQAPADSEASDSTEETPEENGTTNPSQTADNSTEDIETPESTPSPERETSETTGRDHDPGPTNRQPDTSDNEETPVDEAEQRSDENPQSDSPPVLPGDESLPEPEEGAGGNEAEQTAYLNIVDHSNVPAELLRDVTDTPPKPIYDGGLSLTLKPQSLGCGRVDFSQTRVTYRVAVNADGTLRAATPWTGGIESRSLSAGERAIACLLTTSELRFSPALLDGDPILNDNLLLTIDVIEAQDN